MERNSWTLILLTALGLAALVVAYAPAPWPNPVVQEGRLVEELAVPTLRDAAVAVDAACRRGDRASFVGLTSASYREDLSTRLEAADLPPEIDAQTLLAMAEQGSGYAGWLDRPVLATHARYDFVAVAVQRAPDSAGEPDGAQVLVFTWDGAQFLLDEVHHAARVFQADDAARYLRELLRLR